MDYHSPVRVRARSPIARARPLLESPVRTSATPFYSPARGSYVDDPVDAADPAPVDTVYDPYYPRRYYDDYDYYKSRYSYRYPDRYYDSYYRYPYRSSHYYRYW